MKKVPFILAFWTLLLSCNTNQQGKVEVISEKEYNEPHRLQFHFTPPSMWMNDPNGMVYHNGEYHLFYQYNPDSTVWGPMHWGHAVSNDMVHWEHLPIALYPDTLGTIFSGSAVIDANNTSGLGTALDPPMVAIFTYHSEKKEKEGRKDFQTQGIAYSLDDGRSWTKYEGNPVLPNPDIKDFRDPKVMWYENGQKWIMSLAAADHINFYSSPNLIDWSKESEFGADVGAHGGVWECPDLFPLNIEGSQDQKWILLVSINPGGPNGGSGTQYFVGDFDGNKFILDEDFGAQVGDEGIWLDYGRDNYAGVTWANVPKEDGRRLFMGWMSNWAYANVVPTEKWRSAMTVARRLTLENTVNGLRVASQPVEELQKIYGSSYEINSQMISDSLNISDKLPFTSSAFSIDLDMEAVDGASFFIEISNNQNQKFLVGYDAHKNQYVTDRTNAGSNDFSENFAGIHYAPRNAVGNKFSLQILVDVASMELFADGGKTSMTDIFFPDEEFTNIKIYVDEGELRINSGNVTELKSIHQRES